MKISTFYYTYKMNNKTNLFDEYVNFVDSTKKQKTYLTRNTILFVAIISFFLIFLLFNYLNQ